MDVLYKFALFSDSVANKIMRKLIRYSANQLCEINHIQTVHQESFEKYKNCNIGKDIVIVAAGPSLHYYKPLTSAIHIGVNNTYKLQDTIKFDYMFAQDYANGKSKVMIQNIYNMKCEIFFGITLGDSMHEILIPESMTVGVHRYFFSNSLNKRINPDIRFYPLMDFNSVVFPAIHFALFTNPKRIYLVGCDVSSDGHFDAKDINILNDNIKMMKIGYNKVKEFAEKHYPETEIISINPVGLTGLFKDEYTTDFN